VTVIRWGFKAPGVGGLLPANRTITFTLARPVFVRPEGGLPFRLVPSEGAIAVETDENGRGEVTLAELPISTAYLVQIEGGGLWYIQPEGLGPVNLEDLPQIDPSTLEPIESTVTAWELAVATTQAARDAAISAKILSQAAMEAAAGSATTAGSRAADAAGSASAAAGSATAAGTARTGAETAAGAASGSAGAAAGSATAAGNERAAAQTARTGAETARTGAETALSGANLAKSGAETARTGAETARTGAETARTGAEAARDVSLAGQFKGASIPDGADLNTYTTPGVFRTISNATTGLNFPQSGLAGVLEVFQPGGSDTAVIQVFVAFSGGGNPARGMYLRRFRNSAWSAWVNMPSQRIDNPLDQPGVGVYTWDDASSVERQLAVISVSLGTVALNLVTLPGTYVQTAQSSATPARNYPIASAGTLEVLTAAQGGVIQRFTPQFGATGPMRLSAGAWGDWYFISSQRIDNPADQPGVGVYTWDDANSREQQMAIVGYDLGAVDLDLVTLPGSYAAGNGGNVTLARNYPRAGIAGVLEVVRWSATSATQRYTPYPDATTPQRPHGFWIRSYRGTWSPWVFVPEQRIDNPVDQPGVGVYTWDDQNWREQQLMPVGMSLGTVDLNLVTVPGTYYQTGGSASTTRNYPYGVTGGVLEVLPVVSGALVQRYTARNPVPGGKGMHIRTLDTAQGWSEWRFLATQRVDQTAGRAIYTWDDVNNREQLIYGDSGRRQLKAELLNGWTATEFVVRRVGSVVFFAVINLSGAAATGTGLVNIASGFRPVDWVAPAVLSASGAYANGGFYCRNDGYFQCPPAAPIIGSGGVVAAWSWHTVDPWPTTLPGTAVGAIPNL
jgi:hypothetical protein